MACGVLSHSLENEALCHHDTVRKYALIQHSSPMAARQKILILDDEIDILEIYQEILARLPSQPEIHVADNGVRAIARVWRF